MAREVLFLSTAVVFFAWYIPAYALMPAHDAARELSVIKDRAAGSRDMLLIGNQAAALGEIKS